MGQRKTIERGIYNLVEMGLSREEAIVKMRKIYATRLSVVRKGSEVEEAVLNGLSVLADLSRDTEKN